MSIPMVTRSAEAGNKPIHIVWTGGQVVIQPEDNDRFVKSSPWAVDACQSKLAFERYIQDFKSEFLSKLFTWCEEHKDRVQACFVKYPPEGHFQVFVVTTSSQFEFELAEPLSDLEYELTENRRWPCDILQIPNGSPAKLDSYFRKSESIQVYGD
jgi:hypothetical protein